MKTIWLILPLLTLTLGAEDIETIYLKNGCPNCHGFFGQGTSSGPRLQNKKEKLLLRRLHDLQKGITRTPEGTVMLSFAKILDENQTRAMAHYLL
jgi:cytochrome c553